VVDLVDIIVVNQEVLVGPVVEEVLLVEQAVLPLVLPVELQIARLQQVVGEIMVLVDMDLVVVVVVVLAEQDRELLVVMD
jgi:hypothetical protein